MKKRLNFLIITLMTIASVASIRNLSTGAFLGPQLIFFFLIGGLFFLLPAASISARFASTFPEKEGLYHWVSSAFGYPWGFLAVWFQWITSLSWCPLSLSFLTGTLLYFFEPSLVENKTCFVITVIVMYALMTLINIFGICFSGRISSFFSLFGVVLPFFFLSFFLLKSLINKDFNQIEVTATNWIPQLHPSLLVPLSATVLAFCGIEGATIHITQVSEPKKNFPRSLFFSAVIITTIFIFGSLAIAYCVPHYELNMTAGVMQAFKIYLGPSQWLLPFISLSIALGAFSGINSWVLTNTKGLALSAKQGELKAMFAKENRFGSPYVLLIAQFLIVTSFCLMFLLMPTINSSFWMLSTLAAQLYMMMYLLIFAASIKLKMKKITALIGMIFSACTFIIGFFPSRELMMDALLSYEIFLVIGILLSSFLPLLFLEKGLEKIGSKRVRNFFSED